MFSYVVFDLDGTLLDTLQDIANAANHALAQVGLPPYSLEKYKKMVGNGFSALIQSALPSASRQDSALLNRVQREFESYYADHLIDCTSPYPGISEMLKNLITQNISLFVLSNKADDYVQAIVPHFFPEVFRLVRGKLPHYAAKPDPAALLDMLKPYTNALDDVLYCGDCDVDIFTANNAAITSCGVTWGFRGEKELVSCGATLIAHNAQELQSHILGRP